MKRLIVLQGLPGSGKSTYAKTQDGAFVCSADNFFTQADGSYNFNPRQLGAAHNQCFAEFSMAIGYRRELVIVDNTNLTWAEAGRYVVAGLAAGYEVEVRRFNISPQEAFERGIHKVPLATLQKMSMRGFNIPVEVKQNEAFVWTVHMPIKT